MRGGVGASKAQTAVFDRTHRTNSLASGIRSQALSVVAIGALLATTLVLSNETSAQASTPAACALVPVNYDPAWPGSGIRDISSKNDLIWLSLNQSGNLAAEYRLTTDINLGGCLWTPIGGAGPFDDPQFTGKLDGQGNSISGLKVDSSGYAGLFIGLEGDAIIQNLELLEVDIKGADDSGGLAGSLGRGGSPKIENVFVSGTVEATNGRAGGLIGSIFLWGSNTKILDTRAHVSVKAKTDAGGLVAYVDGALITRSAATGTVEGKQDVGGLVGYFESGGDITFSYASGNVTGAAALDSSEKTGGLVGASWGSISNSYARGDVVSSDQEQADNIVNRRTIGGLVAEAESASSIEKAYSTGQISFDERENPAASSGGLIGTIIGSPSITASAWDTQTSGLESSAGGDGVEGLETGDMTSFDTFASPPRSWAIVAGWEPFDAPDKVWGICPAGSDNVVNDGYPFLLWEYDSNPCVNESDTVLGGGSAPGLATPVEKRAASPAIHLDLQAKVGDRVSGAPVVVGGEGLSAGSTMTLVVRSTPQTLVSGRVSSLGNFSTRASLPALTPGSHTLTLTGTAPDGAVLTLVQGFVVGADGTFTSIGQPTGSQTGGLAATGVPANAGVLFAVSSLMLLAIGLSLLRARSRHQFTA